MKVGAIIQARYGASRLPGKVLLPLPMDGDTSVLQQVIRRVQAADGIDEVMVATTIAPADDAVVRVAQEEGVAWYRGSVEDVLARYYFAAKQQHYDIVIRITADCPCHDPSLLARMVTLFQEHDVDYLSNTMTRTFPHGLDAEIFTFAALEQAYHMAKEPSFREHVTPYLYRSGQFTTAQMTCESGTLSRPDIRITLDTPEDYTLLCAVFDLLGESFGLEEIAKLFEAKPWLSNINNSVIQKKVFADATEEIEEALALLKKQDMFRAHAILARAVEGK